MHTPRLDQTENFIWLLLALVILFFFNALFAQLEYHLMSGLVGTLITAAILVAVWSLDKKRSWLKARTGITLLLCLLQGSSMLVKYYGLTIVHLSVLLIFIIATIYYCSRRVLFSGHVDTNKIVGAICVYMLLALAWGLIYLLLETIFPGSIPGAQGVDWRSRTDNAIYFSYVTLTTLGYGDITPTQPLARYFAYMQALTGQFYTAILVASLIGVRLAERKERTISEAKLHSRAGPSGDT